MSCNAPGKPPAELQRLRVSYPEGQRLDGFNSHVAMNGFRGLGHSRIQLSQEFVKRDTLKKKKWLDGRLTWRPHSKLHGSLRFPFCLLTTPYLAVWACS